MTATGRLSKDHLPKDYPKGGFIEGWTYGGIKTRGYFVSTSIGPCLVIARTPEEALLIARTRKDWTLTSHIVKLTDDTPIRKAY